MSRLEGVVESYNEGMLGESEHISLRLGVPNQVILEHFVFVQDLECKVLRLVVGFDVLSDLLNQEDVTERARAQLHDGLKVDGANALLAFPLLFEGYFLVDVDDLDELLLKSAVWFYLLSFLFLLLKLHLLFVLFSFHAPDNSVFSPKVSWKLTRFYPRESFQWC
jgi:hypothetical protein